MTLAHNDRFPTNVCRNNQNKHLRGDVAKARMHAWLSILEAVAEQRDGLQHRIWREKTPKTNPLRLIAETSAHS